MIKHRLLCKSFRLWIWLALTLCLLPSTIYPAALQAQDGLTILESSADVTFPSQLSFSLSVQSDVDINDIRLHYVVERASFAQVISEVYVEFSPGSTVDTEWTWDMRKTGGLPPGAVIDYWWTVTDAKGEQVQTPPERVYFDDTRYPWFSLSQDKIILYWYEGDRVFAEELMNSAQQALNRLAQDTGAYVENPISIYIYADSADLQGAMIYPQEWTGGVAFTRYGVIAIGIEPDDLLWGQSTIAHELAHMVVHQMTFNPYNDLPTWLDEGLAMYAEGMLGPPFTTYLNQAIAEDSLLSVRSISSPFSAYTNESLLAYAESFSLVRFLITNYGQSRMLELLNTFRQGSNYDDALEKVYGFDSDGLDRLWRIHVSAPVSAVGGQLVTSSCNWPS